MKRAPRPRLATPPTAKLSAALLAALLTALLTAAFAATPAGTVISNQASALVEGRTYYSNLVETVILPVCSVAITPDGTPASPAQTANTIAGGTAFLPYLITNNGNTSSTFNLSLLRDQSSDWVPADTTFYLDNNCNGQVDSGEQAVTSVDLDADASACLIVAVQTPDPASGDLYISPVAACPQGQGDQNNFGRVHILSGPTLAVSKDVTPNQVLPGGLIRVSLSVQNDGDAATNDTVYLSDNLAALSGVSYEPSSALATSGNIEYFNGSSWVAQEPATVSGIRLVLDNLGPAEAAVLTFYMRVDDDAQPRVVENRAVAQGPGGPAEAVDDFEILPKHEVFLGPKGNPRALPGGEGSEYDRQEIPYVIAGQKYCFEHTLENDSTVADSFDLGVSGLPEGVQGSFYLDSNTPLEIPVELEAGESIDFLFCVEASEPVPPFTADIKAVSTTTGNENHTYDKVGQVLPADGLVPSKQVDPQGTVTAGTELTYTLQFENDHPIDLTNVVVKDQLDGHLEYISSNPPANYNSEQHSLEWELGSLASGTPWSATVTVKVKEDTPDDVLVENTFSVLADQLPDGVDSNTTETPIWSSQLLLEKQVNPAEAHLGDLLHYVLKAHNPSTAAMTVTITDTPAAGLLYVAGSAVPAEPEQKDGQLIWKAITLAPGETITIEYDMRVVPGASQELVNVAIAEGSSNSGAAIARSRAIAKTRIAEEVFLPKRATIIGRVFLDADRDGKFDEGTDLPLAGARLLLPNGQQVLTDALGNYAFRNVDAGIWEITLDPATAPFSPLPQPEAMDDGYRHRVSAWGVTVSDFPLVAPAGLIEAVRGTSLLMGPMRLDKQIIPLDDGRFRVVLHLHSSELLPELTVRDPLPGGGEKSFNLPEFEGDKTITYELEGQPVLTDPEVRWRYP